MNHVHLRRRRRRLLGLLLLLLLLPPPRPARPPQPAFFHLLESHPPPCLISNKRAPFLNQGHSSLSSSLTLPIPLSLVIPLPTLSFSITKKVPQSTTWPFYSSSPTSIHTSSPTPSPLLLPKNQKEYLHPLASYSTPRPPLPLPLLPPTIRVSTTNALSFSSCSAWSSSSLLLPTSSQVPDFCFRRHESVVEVRLLMLDIWFCPS